MKDKKDDKRNYAYIEKLVKSAAKMAENFIQKNKSLDREENKRLSSFLQSRSL